MRKIIVTCAVTGAAEHTHINPAVPITPEEIALECLSAYKAGAAIVHIHVRDPDTGKPSMEESLYKEVVDRIRQENDDVIIRVIGIRYELNDEFISVIADLVSKVSTKPQQKDKIKILDTIVDKEVKEKGTEDEAEDETEDKAEDDE